MISAPPRPPVAPPAPPCPPHRVFCDGRQFLIVNGRRVWLEEPPADVLLTLLESVR